MAYVLETEDPLLFDLFSRSNNATIGWRQPKEHSIRQCIYIMQTYHLSAAQTAPRFGLREAMVTDILRVNRARDVLRSLGLDESRIVTKTAVKLDQLNYSKPLLKGAAELVLTYRMPVGRATAMVDEIRASGSDADGSKILARWAEDLRREQRQTTAAKTSTNAKGHVKAPRTKLYIAVQSLNRLLLTGCKGKPYPSLAALGVTNAHDRHDLGELWKAAFKHLNVLFHESRQKGK